MRKQVTPRLVIIMGVSGAGKSTVGDLLATRLGVGFIDGDHLHSSENIEKMRNGTALTDADRWLWLTKIAAALHDSAVEGGAAVSACSALKRSYRDRLRHAAGEPIQFVLLDGSKDIIAKRQDNRPGHFMPPELLDSQFATLERPTPDEQFITVSVTDPVDDIVNQICAQLEMN